MRLPGSVALVTGAGTGIGRAIALRFAREGASVIATGRRSGPLLATVAAIRDRGGSALAVPMDVRSPQQVRRVVEATVERFGGLDILVNNAGVGGTTPFMELSLSSWQQTLDTNLTGAFLCAQAAARCMLAKGYGRILNVASISGQRAGFGRTAYGTSKAALIALTRQMAVELGPQGITVNAIAPGPVDTPMTRAMHGAETRRAYRSMIPLGRYGRPEEIAAGALFLVSAEASYVNGHLLDIEGGYVSAGLLQQEPAETVAPASASPTRRSA